MAVRNVKANAVNLPTTTHTYSPTTTGTAGHDESWSTFHQKDGGSGSNTITVTHSFATPRTITQVKYRLYSHGYAYGDSQADVTLSYNLQYTTDGTNWITITTAGA